MSEDMADYIANILASALLGGKNKGTDKILSKEHQEVVERLIK